MKRFSPRWLRNWTDYMSVYERPTKSGRSTYALGIDDAGTRFPIFVISDVPLGCVREFVEDAKRGWRIRHQMRDRGIAVEYGDFSVADTQGVEVLAALGRKCRPVEKENK